MLIVGASNSGCQIALELSATRLVELSVGQRLPTVPQRPFGRDTWAWATALRLDRVTADGRLGRRLAGRVVTFADGAAEYDTVVWATRFTPEYSRVHIPGATDSRGRLRQSRGVTPSPGLYTLGLSWQHTRGSALLG